jgi:hypothetical protein
VNRLVLSSRPPATPGKRWIDWSCLQGHRPLSSIKAVGSVMFQDRRPLGRGAEWISLAFKVKGHSAEEVKGLVISSRPPATLQKSGMD